jgi:hydrogenase maturation factor
MKERKEYGMVRVVKQTHETVSAIADVARCGIGDVVTEMVASIPDNGIEINHKRVLVVKHADGRIEVNPLQSVEEKEA